MRSSRLGLPIASALLALSVLLAGCNANVVIGPTSADTPLPATPTAIVIGSVPAEVASGQGTPSGLNSDASAGTITGKTTADHVPADQLPIAPPRSVTSSKDTLVVAISQEPASLFIPFETSAVAQTVGEAIFDGLVNRDAQDNLYPEDAWYVPTLENGGAYYVGTADNRHLAVKYEIRPGIKWSDGQEVTSADAKFTYDLIMNPLSMVQDRTLWEKVHDVQTPDKYTVIFNFMSAAQAADFYKNTQDKEHFAFLKPFADAKQPVVDPLYNLVGQTIMPQHALSKIPADRILQSDFARNPIGNGPFKLDRWDPGSQIVLVQNPNYTLTGMPLLRKIVVKIISDPNQIIAQLKAGDLDAATADAFPAPSSVLDTLSASGQQVDYVPGREWEHIDFNLDEPQFKDKAVRQALMYAINRQQLVDKLFGGKSMVLNTFLPPASWASMQNPDFAKQFQGKFSINDYKYDPAKANQLLDQAGWVKNADGFRAKNGVTLSFDYATTSGDNLRQQASKLVQADLNAVGIQANLKYIPTDQLFAENGYLAARSHDFAEYAWILDVDPSGSLYDSQNIPNEANSYSGANYPGWKNARFDQLSREAANEPDRSKRAPLFAEMQQIWNEEVPAIPLFTRVSIEVHKSSLVNWDTSAGNSYPLYKAAAMYFK